MLTIECLLLRFSTHIPEGFVNRIIILKIVMKKVLEMFKMNILFVKKNPQAIFVPQVNFIMSNITI